MAEGTLLVTQVRSGIGTKPKHRGILDAFVGTGLRFSELAAQQRQDYTPGVEIRVQREAGPKSTIQEARESAEREHILRALEESNWNVSGAARALGMERTNLHKRIRALGLTRGK